MNNPRKKGGGADANTGLVLALAVTEKSLMGP